MNAHTIQFPNPVPPSKHMYTQHSYSIKTVKQVKETKNKYNTHSYAINMPMCLCVNMILKVLVWRKAGDIEM